MSPSFEYDLVKSKVNNERHGIDFEQAQDLWKAPHAVYPAKTKADEDRYFILGMLNGYVYIAIFTYRGAAIRLISCHRADERLKREYERRSHEP